MAYCDTGPVLSPNKKSAPKQQGGMINLPTDGDTDNLEKAPVNAIHANKSVPELLAIIHQQEEQLNELKAETAKTKLILTSLEQAVDTANLGFAIWDDQLDRDIFVSEVMARIHGMTADAYLEQISSLNAYAQLVHPEDREGWLDNEKLIETDPDYSKSFYEYRVCLPDGRILHLREHSSLIPTADGVGPQYLVVMQDMTEIRQSEEVVERGQQALANSVGLLRLSASMSNLGYAIWSYSENSYSEVSEEWAAIFGYSKSEFNARFTALESDIELVHPSDRQRYLEYYESEEEIDVEYKIVRRDGEVRHVTQSYHYDEGNPNQAFVTLQDITERKLAEAKLIQSSKMITLGEMAAGIAHELNQPLATIKIAAENVSHQASRDSANIPAFIFEKIDRIKQQVVRASSITDQMRIFGREAKEDSYAFDLKEAVANTIDLMSPQLKLEQIEIASTLTSDPVMIWGHQIRLEQVLLNLVSNASFAIKSSGKTQKQLWVEVSCENQDWVTVSVTDTGDGIPNDALERIFEPFYTTKEVGVGTGLGLSVSYGIVHDMEGEMLAENTANGARISLKLPIIKA